MKKFNGPKRVILAVDLKAQEPKLTEIIWSVLMPLLKQGDAIVEPVTVLNREDAAMGKYFENRIGKLRVATERHMEDQLAKLGIDNLAPPKVLFADGSSTYRAVMALLNHAEKSHCDLIALSSHARRGVGRLFLGSFAETLSLQSPIPLLVLNPNQRPVSGELRHILFPTDFSQESKEGLESVCRSFPGTKPKIILLHCLMFQNYIFPAEMYLAPDSLYPKPRLIFDEKRKRAEKLGEEWTRGLRERGFPSGAIIDDKSVSVFQGVLSAVKRQRTGMIAMVSTTGKWGTRFLGSVTRQVLRNSPRPVWVVHPAAPGRTGLKR